MEVFKTTSLVIVGLIAFLILLRLSVQIIFNSFFQEKRRFIEQMIRKGGSEFEPQVFDKSGERRVQ